MIKNVHAYLATIALLVFFAWLAMWKTSHGEAVPFPVRAGMSGSLIFMIVLFARDARDWLRDRKCHEMYLHNLNEAQKIADVTTPGVRPRVLVDDEPIASWVIYARTARDELRWTADYLGYSGNWSVHVPCEDGGWRTLHQRDAGRVIDQLGDLADLIYSLKNRGRRTP